MAFSATAVSPRSAPGCTLKIGWAARRESGRGFPWCPGPDRRIAGEHFVEQRAKGIDVAPRVFGVAGSHGGDM